MLIDRCHFFMPILGYIGAIFIAAAVVDTYVVGFWRDIDTWYAIEGIVFVGVTFFRFSKLDSFITASIKVFLFTIVMVAGMMLLCAGGADLQLVFFQDQFHSYWAVSWLPDVVRIVTSVVIGIYLLDAISLYLKDN